MSTPKRWIETESGSSELERELLRPALDLDIPAGAEERVWMGLATLLPISAAAASSSLPGAAGGAAAGSSSAAALKAATTGGAVVATSIGKAGFAMVAKAFAIGATSGALVAGGYAALDNSFESAPAERTTSIERPALDRAPQSPATARSPGSLSVPSPGTTAAGPSSASLPPAVRSDSSSLQKPAEAVPEGRAAKSTGSFAALPAPQPESASDSRASRLGEEARALKRARDALRAGDLGAAFAALEAARSEFPNGALGEEREALTIQLLARSGQSAAARTRAESFLRSFPNSAHAPRVRALAGSLPP